LIHRTRRPLASRCALSSVSDRSRRLFRNVSGSTESGFSGRFCNICRICETYCRSAGISLKWISRRSADDLLFDRNCVIISRKSPASASSIFASFVSSSLRFFNRSNSIFSFRRRPASSRRSAFFSASSFFCDSLSLSEALRSASISFSRRSRRIRSSFSPRVCSVSCAGAAGTLPTTAMKMSQARNPAICMKGFRFTGQSSDED